MWLILLVVSLLGILQVDGCDPSKCKGTCRCMSSDAPNGMPLSTIPQLVMLTFDDAVNQINFPLYKELFLSGKQNPSKCNIGATFFATHDYNNYAQLNQLWSWGNEIAIHTITHETDLDMWREASFDRWKNDSVGMRKYIAEYAMIPEKELKGFRAPFLQTSGDETFKMLKNEGFMYDSSMITQSYAGKGDNDSPIWPYTLDHPFRMDCMIGPCPTGSYPGLWEVPLISWFKQRKEGVFPCAMADACLQFPETEGDTYDYFMENFNRHYKKNKAPFPVFLHESWLKVPGRKAGYVKFFNELMGMKDVFIVTLQEVVEFMMNPKAADDYKEKRCQKTPEPSKCKNKYCYYEQTKRGEARSFFTCTDCPVEWPWLET